MINLNLFSLFAFITFLTCFFLGSIFIIYGKNKLHKIWALFNFSIAGWAIFVSLASISTSPQKAYQFWIISHLSGICVAIFNFHAICIFCNLRCKSAIKISYCYGVLFYLIHFINGGSFLYYGVNYLYNSIFYLYAKKFNFLGLLTPWLMLAILSNYKLYTFFRNSSDLQKRNESLRLLIGATIGYLGGISSFLPMLGFYNFYPLTIILVAFYGLFLSYSIFKYQIFELNIILRKSFVYSILVAVITIIYIITVLIIERLFQGLIGYQTIIGSICAAIIIAVIFIPLKNKLQFIVDKLLLKAEPIEIIEENELLKKEIVQTEKFKAVATLASGIAHEIKNPLTTIKTFFDYLPEKRNDPEFLDKLNRVVGSEINRVDGLVHQLLEFAKPSPLQLQDTNITKIIDDSLSLLENRLKQHKVQVVRQFTIHDPRTTIQADPNKLKQAFLNILLNAIDAMPNGGTLTVSTDLRSSVTPSVLICVRDSGCGIDKKDLPHIFDPFFTKKETGTGLGLAITQGIIQEHKGKIKVESTLGIGSKFIIELPLATNDQ